MSSSSWLDQYMNKSTAGAVVGGAVVGAVTGSMSLSLMYAAPLVGLGAAAGSVLLSGKELSEVKNQYVTIGVAAIAYYVVAFNVNAALVSRDVDVAIYGAGAGLAGCYVNDMMAADKPKTT